jgi:hypothetical protein
MNATPEKIVSRVRGSRARTVRSIRIAAANAPAKTNITPAVT